MFEGMFESACVGGVRNGIEVAFMLPVACKSRWPEVMPVLCRQRTIVGICGQWRTASVTFRNRRFIAVIGNCNFCVAIICSS
jgi:hypothetical protein